MATALGRINGGEIIKYSEIDRQFADADPAFYFVMTDPLVPDGILLREVLPIIPGQARYGPRRQLGFAKIGIPVTNTIRNATQAEIDLFDDAEGQDEQAIDAIQAREQAVKHPILARVLWPLIRMLVANSNQQNARINLMAAKVNLLTTQWEDAKNIMGSGVTVANMRTQIAALADIPVDIPVNLPDSRTAIAVAQSIRDDIQNNDAPRRGA